MPAPKELSSYPSEYAQLFETAARKPITIELDTPAQANTLRSRLYSYRQAIYNYPELMPRVTLVAPLVRMSISFKTLTLEPKEPNSLTEKVNDALERAR